MNRSVEEWKIIIKHQLEQTIGEVDYETLRKSCDGPTGNDCLNFDVAIVEMADNSEIGRTVRDKAYYSSSHWANEKKS